MSYLTFILSVVLSFHAGTAAHELTHWAVAKLVGARIEHVSLFPPSPMVVYEAQTQGDDRVIRASTVPAGLLVLIACLLVARGASLRTVLVLIAFAVAYLPRSQSDWQPVRQILTPSG
jgi:urea transporter